LALGLNLSSFLITEGILYKIYFSRGDYTGGENSQLGTFYFFFNPKFKEAVLTQQSSFKLVQFLPSLCITSLCLAAHLVAFGLFQFHFSLASFSFVAALSACLEGFQILKMIHKYFTTCKTCPLNRTLRCNRQTQVYLTLITALLMINGFSHGSSHSVSPYLFLVSFFFAKCLITQFSIFVACFKCKKRSNIDGLSLTITIVNFMFCVILTPGITLILLAFFDSYHRSAFAYFWLRWMSMLIPVGAIWLNFVISVILRQAINDIDRVGLTLIFWGLIPLLYLFIGGSNNAFMSNLALGNQMLRTLLERFGYS